MNHELLRQLKAWRDEQARIEGVETYRVMNNATLEALVGRQPATMLELLEVKGIKAAKSRKYGKALLGILEEFKAGNSVEAADPRSTELEITNYELGQAGEEATQETTHHEPLTVSQFLDSINIELSGLAARVRGEVTSVDFRERVVYFSLKDPEDEGMVSCVIFRYPYDVSGVALAVGDEVIVEGVPEIYKPSGRFSLKVGVIELAGEGALKKAYDALKAKLEAEGVFSEERKRSIPSLAERIALITSQDGAAIGDFTMNVGRIGLQVDFYPTAVEGKRAVFEIIEALRFFQQSNNEYDCLVLIRGGGSLESLQAFNNEALVREVAKMPMPVLAGIGHEKDVTLAALAADVMVSTPTAAARTIGGPWEEARIFVRHAGALLLQAGTRILDKERSFVDEAARFLESQFESLVTLLDRLEQSFREKLQIFPYLLSGYREKLIESQEQLVFALETAIRHYQEQLKNSSIQLRQHDPKRLLTLGYSLVRSQGKIIRSVDAIEPGDRLDIQLSHGTVESEVIKKL